MTSSTSSCLSDLPGARPVDGVASDLQLALGIAEALDRQTNRPRCCKQDFKTDRSPRLSHKIINRLNLDLTCLIHVDYIVWIHLNLGLVCASES